MLLIYAVPILVLFRELVFSKVFEVSLIRQTIFRHTFEKISDLGDIPNFGIFYLAKNEKYGIRDPGESHPEAKFALWAKLVWFCDLYLVLSQS